MHLSKDIVITKNRAIAKSYAKINLTLDVLGTLPNGYHQVAMVMQSLSLFDLIIVDKQKSGIKISCNVRGLPHDKQNIAYKAADLFFTKTGISGGAKILIHKNIPIAAGLAGGSGNAAAVLCALDLLYNTHLPQDELMEMGLSLGADVPYCITGGTQLACGIGEKLTPLSAIKGVNVLLVKPNVNISTAAIYHKIDSSENLVHPDTNGMLSAIENGDVDEISKKLSNLMETVTSADCPEILSIKEKMLELGAIGSAMSGSGPTVFGIFPDMQTAKVACDAFSKEYDEVFMTHTIE